MHAAEAYKLTHSIELHASFQRILIEIERAAQEGYDSIRTNLSESTPTEERARIVNKLNELGYRVKLSGVLDNYLDIDWGQE
jgi:hypothetical protein